MKKILYAFVLMTLAVSCKVGEIKTFGEERFIHFDTIENKYEYTFSFLYAEGKEEVEISLPVKYAGRMYTSAMPYAVKVVEEETTAKAGEEFFLPENILFKASSYQDKLVIKLKKTARMDQEKLKIRLKLESDQNFTAAMKNALVMDIQVTNVIDQPVWWNDEVINSYLGEYSDKKFELFVKNIFAGDYGKLDTNGKRYWALQFKAWLAAHPDQAVEDGKVITVPVIG